MFSFASKPQRGGVLEQLDEADGKRCIARFRKSLCDLRLLRSRSSAA
jgi:hypothetical protein